MSNWAASTRRLQSRASGGFAVALGFLWISVATAAEARLPCPSDTIQSAPAVVAVDPVRAGDEVWLIDSRGVCGFESAEDFLAQLHVRQLVAGQWVASDPLAFQAAAAAPMDTVFYVHGNRVEPGEAYREGWAMYRGLAQQMSEAAPIRFVIWSWPASQIKGQLRDLRVKAARTNQAGYQLAMMLSQLEPTTQVTLMGYSYGARVATGSLHLLGGGALGHYQLVTAPVISRRPARVVLMAAALHNDWLLPGRYHGQALSQIDHLLLLNNSADRALRRYRIVTPHASPEALGFTGFAGLSRLGMLRERVEQLNVANLVGPVHDVYLYARSPRVMGLAKAVVVEPPAPPLTVQPAAPPLTAAK